MKVKIKTTILVAVLVLLLGVGIIVATMGFMSTANAEVASGEEVSGEVIAQPQEEAKGNWFSENWKVILEIIMGGGAFTAVIAIMKVISKIATLKTALGSTNTDNKAIKEAFNSMVDEVEDLKSKLDIVHKLNELLKIEVAASAEKSGAVLAIFEKLINASDLPSETKQSMQAVINKAETSEVHSNDEA